MQKINMEKEFVPLKQSLELIKLGLQPRDLIAEYIEVHRWNLNSEKAHVPTLHLSEVSYDQYPGHPKYICSAPLWQQAFDWFREQHKLEGWVYPFFIEHSKTGVPYLVDKSYGYYIFQDGAFVCDRVDIMTIEEARIQLLNKLIEICKTNQ